MWLKEIRIGAGLSQKEVASRVGITQQGYSFIETGQRAPSVRNAHKIAAALGFDWQRFYDEPSEAK